MYLKSIVTNLSHGFVSVSDVYGILYRGSVGHIYER